MPNLLLRGRAQQLHGPLSFMLLPALSRAKPEFFILKWQSPKEGCGTLGLLRFRWKRNRHLLKRFPYPAASTSHNSKTSIHLLFFSCGSSNLFSSRELQDWGSIREGRGLHFVGRSRKDPIRAGTKKCKTLFTLFIDRKDIDEISF